MNFHVFHVFIDLAHPVPELEVDPPAAKQPGRQQQDPDVCQPQPAGGHLQREPQLAEVGVYTFLGAAFTNH